VSLGLRGTQPLRPRGHDTVQGLELPEIKPEFLDKAVGGCPGFSEPPS